jgi:hypothetical protein
MDQISFSNAEYQRKRRPTGREKFLAEVDRLIPWRQLEKRLAQPYDKRKSRSAALSAERHAEIPQFIEEAKSRA